MSNQPFGRVTSVPFIVSIACLALAAARATAAPDTGIVDTLSFADPASEQSHQAKADPSDTIQGGLGEAVRRLLPPKTPGWEGGRFAFTMKVDPARPNYVTVRLWGSDVNTDRLMLFCEGKQVGYRHLGDVDSLDVGNEAPFCPGRFFYNTSPLPAEMTKGKGEVHLEIRASGRIWTYGRNFAEYQKPMTEPSRGLYRVYTHTDGAFVPPADEKQGRRSPTRRCGASQGRRCWTS